MFWIKKKQRDIFIVLSKKVYNRRKWLPRRWLFIQSFLKVADGTKRSERVWLLVFSSWLRQSLARFLDVGIELRNNDFPTGGILADNQKRKIVRVNPFL